jgi:hypothetical protein
MEGGAPEPTLADMTEKAIKILRRGKNGYFLLVEGKYTNINSDDGISMQPHERRLQTLPN